MKIAYNPTTAAALSSAPNNIDVVFDLKGLNIFAKGIKFQGTDDKVLQSATTTSNYRPLILGYQNSTDVNSLANSTTNQVYATTKLYAQPSTGYLWAQKLYSGGKEVLTSHQSLSNYVTINTAQTITGQKTFSSDIHFSGAQSLFWNNGTYQQKISITDDSTSGTSVFNFQQSTNSGSSWTNLLQIYDNGILHSSGYAKNGSSDSYVLLGGGGHKAVSDFATSSSLGNYVTINTTQTITGQKTFSNPIISSYSTNTYLAGNQGKALINSTAGAGAYVMLFKGNSTNGYFTHGVYQGSYLLQYTAKSTVDAGTNSVTRSVTLLNESGNSIFPGTITATKFIGPLQGNADTATNADMLDGYHLNYGQNPFGKIPFVGSDGVMEVGRYIDFHYDNNDTSDYNVRLQTNTSGIKVAINLPSASGTLARTVDNVASATKLQTSRQINGTNFDGTSNITTSYWGATRTISLTGAVTGSVSTNGSGNITINTTYGTGNITNLDSRYVNATGDTMTGSLTIKTGIASLYLINTTNTSTNGNSDGGFIQFNSTDNQNVRIRHSWYDTERVGAGLIIEKGSGNTNGSECYLWVKDGSVVSNNFVGNASSASKLQTARQINGTNFDGSANITTSYWGTTRTLTIGNSGKSVNGSANISWSLSEIGAAATNHTHNYIVSRGNVTAESGTANPAVSGLSMSQVYSNGYPTTFGNVITLNGAGKGQLLIGWSGTSGATAPVYVRSKRDTGDANWSSWAQFYTTANPQVNITGNAATATKLQTARSLWGNMFDGTNNIYGRILINPTNATGYYDEGIRIKPHNNWSVVVLCGNDNTADNGTSANTWGLFNNNGDFYINRNGSSGHTGYELCNINGNWGVGTNSPAYKLHVNGAGHFTDYVNIPTLRIYGTSDNMSWNRGPGRIIFAENTSDAQALSLVYTSYDSVRSPAGIKLTGSQGNEWFEAPRIIKTGSSDSYVLLGGGGHKAVSDFATASSLNNYVTLTTAQTISGVKTFSTQQKFTVGNGTAPFTVSSNTLVTNLNADLLDGLQSTSFMRCDGTNSISLTGGNGNTAGWRLVLEKQCGGWTISNISIAIAARHTGQGILSIGFHTTNADGTTYTYSINFKGSTASQSSGAWRAFYNTSTKKFRLFWYYNDYGTAYINALSRSGFDIPKNGTWYETLPTDNGTELTVYYDNSSTATRLLTARKINGTSFDGTSDITTAYWGTTRTISLTGAITGSVSTNGGGNITINTTYGTGNITNLDNRYVNVTGDTMTGALNLANGTWNKAGDDSAFGDANVAGNFCIKALNTTNPGITFFNNSGTNLGSLISNGNILQWRGSTIWHAGNDGSGSGLDADLLDGQHASAFSYKSWWHWSGQGGQPSWLWGGNTQHQYYVYNPANFTVAVANRLGTSTVGNANTPIYLNGGTPTACTNLIGSGISWAYYRVTIGSSSVTYSRLSGNFSFISGASREGTGQALLTLSYPSGASKSNIIMMASGHHMESNWASAGYASIQPDLGNSNQVRLMTADDASKNNGDAVIMFLYIRG